MNYRHHFHAGNFADVMKHALLVQLVRALQRKEKGFLVLDTHAGRGSYDLTAAAHGDTLARQPEWPDGIGRLWERTDSTGALGEYLAVIRQFDRERGNLDTLPRFYPGSPQIARLLARPQDRLALCEKHPDECAALAAELDFVPHVTVQATDGYTAVKALLPPPERRALVLIDPPFEEQDEFERIVTALRDGLARLGGGVFAIWYPLTERARLDAFFTELQALRPPPTLNAELIIAGDASPLKMRGCGLVVVNPPWQFAGVTENLLQELSRQLAQQPGSAGRVEWLVPEQ
jgi:23S rRNA (adenine2030-N6)-methyltransferase